MSPTPPSRRDQGTLPVPSHVCRACLGTDVRLHRPSRRTGLAVLGCRTCGAHMLADPPTSAELMAMGDSDAEDFSAWADRLRSHTLDAVHRDTLRRLDGLVGPVPGRSLFDLGAGAGGFLSLAREAGFEPAGCDISRGAVDVTKARHDIDIQHGDVADVDAGSHDALTMWCVLAHVPEADRLLRDAVSVLKPGGVLFMQTPRWSAMDRAGLAMLDASGGRATRIVDRRVALHHMLHHTERSLRATLERAGLEVIEIRSTVRFSLTTVDYLESIRVGPRLRAVVGKPLDAMIERGWFSRNVLDAYARVPA